MGVPLERWSSAGLAADPLGARNICHSALCYNSVHHFYRGSAPPHGELCHGDPERDDSLGAICG